MTAQPDPDKPADQPITNSQSAPALGAGSGAARFQSTRSDRSAGPSIHGYWYQALVTISRLLDVGSGQTVIVEGREDVVVLGPSPQGSTLDPQNHVNVKYTSEQQWSMAEPRVYESALEFLITYAAGAHGDVTFEFITPATFAGRDARILHRWQAFPNSPVADPTFPNALRDEMAYRLGQAKGNLQENAQKAHAAVTGNGTWADFGRRVRWHDDAETSEALVQQLAERLRERYEARTGLRGSTCVYLLNATILYRASLPLAQRVLGPDFIESTLMAASSKSAGWNDAAAVATLAASVGVAAAAQHWDTQLRPALEQAFADLGGQILSRIDARHAGSDLPSGGMTQPRKSGAEADPLLPFGASVGGARNTDDQDIVDLIVAGQFRSALHLIEERLKQALGLRQGQLLYLRASAWAGMSPYQAQQAALDAAHAFSGTPWETLLLGQAALHEGTAASFGDLLPLSDHVDDQIAATARILVAEIAYQLDDTATMLRMVEKRVSTPRAVRLRIRAFADQGRLDEAQRLVDDHIGEAAERARLQVHLELRRFFLTTTKLLQRREPDHAAVMQHCERLDGMIQTALDLNPFDAQRRRLELLVNRGLVAVWANRFDRAIPHLQEALRIDASLPTAQYNLACAFAKDRRPIEALQAAKLAIAHCKAGQEGLRAEATILAGALRLAQALPLSEATGLLTSVIDDPTSTVDQRQRARHLLIRLLSQANDAAAMRRILDTWPEAERGDRYDVAKAVVCGDACEYAAVVDLVTAVDSHEDVEPALRHEARMYACMCYFNLGRFVEAMRAGRSALALGLGDEGSEIVLTAAYRSGDMEATRDIEEELLAANPRHVHALRMRRFRLQQAGDLAGAGKVAEMLVVATDDVADRVHVAVLWSRIGDEDRAADVLLPASARLTTPFHLLLASELQVQVRDDWAAGLDLALRAHEADPTNVHALQIALLRLHQARARIPLSPEILERGGRVMAYYFAHPTDPPMLVPVPTDGAEGARRAQRAAAWMAQVLLDHERRNLSSFEFAASCRLGHAEAIFQLLGTPGVHLHTGRIANAEPAEAQRFVDHYKRLILDLPSIVVAQRVGTLEKLRSRWRLAMSADQYADLRAYRSRVSDLLAHARSGGKHDTVNGIVQLDPKPYEVLLATIDAVLSVVPRMVEVIETKPHLAISGTVSDGPARTQLELYAHKTADDEIVVALEQSVRPAHVAPLHVVLQFARLAKVIAEPDYESIAIDLLRLGVRRVVCNIGTLAVALARDRDGIGDSTRAVLNLLRSGQWNRDRLVHVMATAIVSWPVESPLQALMRSLVLAAILHGRSFDKKTRGKALRQLRAYVRNLLPHREGRAAQVQAASVWRVVDQIARLGDPVAKDQGFAGRRSLYGRRS